jgi:cytoskeletal protein CcmA (bactofilin family)
MGKWRFGAADGIEGTDIISLLGEGTSFVGELVLEGGARIDGKVAGRITTQSLLVVGPNGDLDLQELRAAAVTVCGTVRGTLMVRERLEIRPGGRVQGHLIMEKQGLVVAPGGSFEGVVEYTHQPESDPVALDELAVEVPA